MTTSRIFKIIEEYEQSLTSLEDREVRRVNQSIELAYKALIKEFRAKYLSLEENITLLPAQRQVLIIEQLGELLSIINPENKKEYEATFRGLIRTSHELGGKQVEEVIREIDPDFKAASFARLPVNAIALSAEGAYRRLQRHGDAFALQATQLISQGLAQGWGNQKISRALKNQAIITQSRAEMIIRTETSTASIGASKSRYKDSGIKYGLWSSVLTEVCPWCVWRSGKIFLLSEIVIPQHPRCRCSIIPITPQWAKDDLLDFDAIDRSSEKVRSHLGAAASRSQLDGNPRTDKAPFEISAPTPIPLDRFRRMRG